MENAVKAMYIAAGMLLGVMILSVWVYLFRQGASLGQNYEADQKTQQITAFNNQFEKYTNVTSRKLDGTFEAKGNLPSDVVTCANLAYNINRKSEFDTRDNVEVIVVIGTDRYYVNSCEQQPKNYFIKNRNRSASSSLPTNPTQAQLDDTNTYLSFDDFMKTYSNVKIDSSHTDNELIYEYYFDVDETRTNNTDILPGALGRSIQYSNITGKVVRIVFIANKTTDF